MKKTATAALLLAAAAALSACGAMPHHDTVAASHSPVIDASAMPLGAVIFVDGRPIGTVSKDQTRFATDTGTHMVRVEAANGAPIFSGELYFSKNTTRKIDLP
ncbi:MAG: hypothetical protein EP335_05850 [Alphaproteobacteria bacterium]|nr:MAG: hypothetical protein EP335_05850 [Alphaproteobacteria bacterium]